MKRKIILDTGPLVALLNLRDTYHSWARAEFAEIEPPLLSCEAVISEACFLLRAVPGGPRTVLHLLNRGVVEIPFRLADEADPVMRLLRRYASVPMALADACLVRMVEQHAKGTVMTLDTDFLVYRKQGRQVVPTIMPGVARRRTRRHQAASNAGTVARERDPRQNGIRGNSTALDLYALAGQTE